MFVQATSDVETAILSSSTNVCWRSSRGDDERGLPRAPKTLFKRGNPEATRRYGGLTDFGVRFEAKATASRWITRKTEGRKKGGKKRKEKRERKERGKKGENAKEIFEGGAQRGGVHRVLEGGWEKPARAKKRAGGGRGRGGGGKGIEKAATRLRSARLCLFTLTPVFLSAYVRVCSETTRRRARNTLSIPRRRDDARIMVSLIPRRASGARTLLRHWRLLRSNYRIIGRAAAAEPPGNTLHVRNWFAD